MKGLLEDNATGGALPVDISVAKGDQRTRVAFRRKGIDMALVVRTADIKEEFEEDDDRK